MKAHTPDQVRTAGGTPSASTIVLIVLAVWLATAITVAVSGVIEDLPRPVLPILIWSPVLVFLVVLGVSRGFRTWTLELHLRWLVLYHVVRAGVGTGFLLMSGGDLPTDWAVPAGIGDIVVGATAVLVALYVPARTALRRRVVFGWNPAGTDRHGDGLRHGATTHTFRRQSRRSGRANEISAARDTAIRRTCGTHHTLRHFCPVVEHTGPRVRCLAS